MAERDHRLDFVKGFLVFAMVLYHTMNYFADVPPEIYGYLRFVNGAFVFVSGYVISHFYRPSSGRNLGSVSMRLVTRGAKLLLLFTFLNVVISALGLTSYRSAQFGLDRFVSELVGVYVRGDSTSMAFRILVPISYVLMVAPLLLAIGPRWNRITAVVVLAGAFLYSWLGGLWPNVYFLLVGLAGIATGSLVAYEDLPRIASWLGLAVAFVLTAAVMNFLSGNVAAYSLGVFLALKLVYDWAGTLRASSPFVRTLVAAGQYSLVAYIAQIAFLYFMRLLLPEGLGRIALFSFALALTGVLMSVMPVAISRLRNEYPAVDRLYRLVFA